MQEKLLVGSVVALALGVAGCGGGSGSSSSAASTKTAAKAGPIVIYRTALSGTTGTPTGARGGAGNAVVALHGSTVLCWRFAHLRGFAHATAARLQLGSNGSAHVIASLSTGSRLHHKGCRTISPTTAKAIQKRPSAYYVAIDSTGFPAGAVRGRL